MSLLPTILISTLLGLSSAHSWVEEIQAISSNGSYTGDYGYTRGYVARTDPIFTGESMKYILPAASSGRTRIDSTDLLCHPSQRTSSSYNSAYPRLQVSPGTFISMKYLENGHVTLPATQPGKPASGGPVFVFATTSPSDTEKIADVLQWTSDASGGDKRGSLIGVNNYDDGRCHQLNSGAISTSRQQSFPDRVPGQPTSNVEQWCETDVQIPASAKTGSTMTLYWVWSWPTAAGVDSSLPDGKDEWYTSCSEVEIVADGAASSSAIHTLVQQDPQSTAVSDWASRTAITSAPPTVSGASAFGTASASSSVPTSSASMSTSTSASSSIYTSASNGRLNLPYITYSLSYLPAFQTSTISASVSTSSVLSLRFSSPAPGQSSSAASPPSEKTVTATTTDFVTVTASAGAAGQASASGYRFRY